MFDNSNQKFDGDNQPQHGGQNNPQNKNGSRKFDNPPQQKFSGNENEK